MRLVREKRGYRAEPVRQNAVSTGKGNAIANKSANRGGSRLLSICWEVEGFDSDAMHADLFLEEATCLQAGSSVFPLQPTLKVLPKYGQPCQHTPVETLQEDSFADAADVETGTAATINAAVLEARAEVAAAAAATTTVAAEPSVAATVICPDITAQIVAATAIQHSYRQWHQHWHRTAGPLTSTDFAKSRHRVYTLEELTNPRIWRNLDVDPLGREMLLPDSRFQDLFGFDKDGFQHLPQWRKERLKKTVGFF